MKLRFAFLLTLAPLLFSGCQLGSDDANRRLKERAGNEAEQVQIKEQEAREKIVTKMENDLRRRQRLYQSVKGAFNGELVLDGDRYSVFAEFVPSVIPFVDNSRVRTQDEVSEDIQKLSFDLRIVFRDLSTKALLLNCASSGVRFDLDAGSMSWLSESSNCSNFFTLHLSSDEVGALSSGQMREQSRSMTAELLSGQISKVEQLVLGMRPGALDEIFTIVLKRVEL